MGEPMNRKSVNPKSASQTLMSTFARTVGRAAGTIARTTQELAENAAAMVHADSQKAPARTAKRRTTSTKTKKGRTAKPSLRRSAKPKKRGAHRAGRTATGRGSVK